MPPIPAAIIVEIVMTHNTNRFLTKAETCEVLRISSTTFHALCKRGDLAFCKLGSKTVVRIDEVARFADELGADAAARAAARRKRRASEAPPAPKRPVGRPRKNSAPSATAQQS